MNRTIGEYTNNYLTRVSRTVFNILCEASGRAEATCPHPLYHAIIAGALYFAIPNRVFGEKERERVRRRGRVRVRE